MTTCETVQAALLDESLARDGDAVTAHLASCAACRDVASGHRAALALSRATPVRAVRRSVAKTQRRLAVLGSLTLVVAGASGWAWLELNPRQVAPAPAVELVMENPPVRVVAEDDEAERRAWEGLASLTRLERDAVSGQYREETVTLRVFGALPRWVAPHKSSPVRALGRAASPVVFTQEDVP